MGKNCESCTQWQEHCYWSHMADENKHFFKLMVGDFRESMSIPGRFAKNFNGHISEDMNRLKSPSGKCWRIGVTSDADEVVLRSGWKGFVNDHGIEEGDCLLFKYSGASSFDVWMFDPNGCHKTSHRPVKNRGCEVAEYSARVEGAQRGYNAFRKTQDRAPHSPPTNGDVANLQMTLHRDTEQAHLVVEDNDDLEMDDGEAAARTRYHFCKNGPVSEFRLTEEDKEEISSVPVPVEPRNPVFVAVIHSSHVRTTRTSILGVSSEFAGKHLGAVGSEIILRRPGSKGRWHVSYRSGDNYRGFCGRGWRDFARDNGLLAHDMCLFELMEGARRSAATVHVLRKVRGRFVLVP